MQGTEFRCTVVSPPYRALHSNGPGCHSDGSPRHLVVLELDPKHDPEEAKKLLQQGDRVGVKTTRG
jgi:hypothetical protein